MTNPDHDNDTEDETVEDFPAYQPGQSSVAKSIYESEVEIAALTHPGLVRENNEDHYAVLRRTRASAVVASSLETHQLPKDDSATTWLLVVADGLGGHAAGEVASATAISAIINLSSELSSWIMRPNEGELTERVKLYADAIQKALGEMARQHPSLHGMATTINAVYLLGRKALVVNVGDSRAYLLRDRAIQQITADHTLAQHMQKEGLSPESTSRFRNLVTRTFNTDRRSVEFDVYDLQLEPGDQILLCSDGLSDMVDDAGILHALTEAPSAANGCERLLEAALAAGGRDNVTTVLARIHRG